MGVSERKADEYVGREAAIAAIFVRVGMRTIGTRLQPAYEEAIDAIANLPAADVAPVIYCRYCAYCVQDVFTRDGLERVHAVEPYDFCSYGLKGESR